MFFNYLIMKTMHINEKASGGRVIANTRQPNGPFKFFFKGKLEDTFSIVELLFLWNTTESHLKHQKISILGSISILVDQRNLEGQNMWN